MAAAINGNQQPLVETKEETPFLDKHFTKIAFAASTVALFILAPLFLVFGSAAGLAAHWYFEPQLTLKPGEEAITVPHAVLAIVGAVGAVIKLLPAGALGGLVFQVIPLFSYLSIGSAAYRMMRSATMN